MKVLLAVDGSEGSATARDLVAGLAWPAETQIHLVTAYQVPIEWAPDLGGAMPWLDDAETVTRDELGTMLSSMAGPLTAAGISVAHHAVRGRAATAICDTAAAIAADLVVTGSRGRGPVTSMLLGSVAAEIASDAPCSVLVARTTAVRRLIVATDGSPAADAVADRLEAWGILAGVPADVVAVSIPDSPGFELVVGLYTLGDERLAEERRALRDGYRSDAGAMAERLTAIGIPATPRLRAGDPAHEILALQAETSADLIVTGSHGRGRIERLVLGSVARNVLVHASCSVLVVRVPAERAAAVDRR